MPTSRHCHRFGRVAQVEGGPVTPQAIAAQRSDTGVIGVTSFSTRFTERPCVRIDQGPWPFVHDRIQTTKEPMTPVTPVSDPCGYATCGVTGRDTSALALLNLCHHICRLTEAADNAGDNLGLNAGSISCQRTLTAVDHSRLILDTPSTIAAGGGR